LCFQAQLVLLHLGKKLGLYVHSKLPGDQAIVYDNTQYGSAGKKDDGKLVIWPGTAHLSNKPFGRRAPWGGDALRPRRQFVGRVGYAVRWLLWNPEVHDRFPKGFKDAVQTMLLCATRRDECYLTHCGDEIIFYIMNKCGWDWFGTAMRDGPSDEEKNKAEEEEAARRGRLGRGGRLSSAHTPHLIISFGRTTHSSTAHTLSHTHTHTHTRSLSLSLYLSLTIRSLSLCVYISLSETHTHTRCLSLDPAIREQHMKEMHLARMFGVAPAHAANLMQHMDPALLQMIHHQVMDGDEDMANGWGGGDDGGDDDDDGSYEDEDDEFVGAEYSEDAEDDDDDEDDESDDESDDDEEGAGDGGEEGGGGGGGGEEDMEEAGDDDDDEDEEATTMDDVY
jgi:hypothetical protein